MPPCSAASRGSAALRPCGRLRRPGPGLRAAAVWPLSSAAGPALGSNGRPAADVAQIVRDVLGADRLLGQARGRRRARSAASPWVCSSACSRSTSWIQICGRRCVSSVRYAEAAGPDRANAGAADSAGRVCRRPRPRAGRDARAGSSRRRAANCRSCSAPKRPATIRTRSR